MKEAPEKYRIGIGHPLAGKMPAFLVSDESFGNSGIFILPRMGKDSGYFFQCMISDFGDWEHVSISIVNEKRCPTWEEMCFIKDTFWAPEECVIQFHPAKEDYVSEHEFCLHLWKYRKGTFPTPDPIMIGLKKK